MKALVLLLIIPLGGCCIVHTETVHVNLLCDRTLIDTTGVRLDNFRSVEDNHHIKCNGREPLQFIVRVQ